MANLELLQAPSKELTTRVCIQLLIAPSTIEARFCRTMHSTLSKRETAKTLADEFYFLWNTNTSESVASMRPFVMNNIYQYTLTRTPKSNLRLETAITGFFAWQLWVKT